MFRQIAKLKSGASDIVRKYEGEKPRTAGRVYQTVGGLLVADGLIGLENPFSNRKSRAGIFGALVLSVIGLAIMAGAFFIVKVPQVDSMVTGSISRISEPKIDKEDGTRTCSYDVSYAVDGKDYTVNSSFASDKTCHRGIGEPVDVHYLAAKPSRGVLELGTQKAIRWGGLGLGLLISIIGATTFLIRAGTIFFGIKLFLRGRKLIRTSPPGEGDDGNVVATAKEAFMEMRFG